jgi:hypothetical protein
METIPSCDIQSQQQNETVPGFHLSEWIDLGTKKECKKKI